MANNFSEARFLGERTLVSNTLTCWIRRSGLRERQGGSVKKLAPFSLKGRNKRKRF